MYHITRHLHPLFHMFYKEKVEEPTGARLIQYSGPYLVNIL